MRRVWRSADRDRSHETGDISFGGCVTLGARGWTAIAWQNASEYRSRLPSGERSVAMRRVEAWLALREKARRGATLEPPK